MTEIIMQKLEEIEKAENVRIIHAVESGSRAWGFASPDSDYDVRFIYVRPEEFYLRLDKTRDVIEWQLDDTLDINGWDIKKALSLLFKSNPTLFEWNMSPLIYKTTDTWKMVSEKADDYFLEKAALYHYISTAKSNYFEYLTKPLVKYKKYFYVLRPILACKWIIEKKTPPPMLFSELMDKMLEKEMLPAVNRLLDIKILSLESESGEVITELNEYIEKSLQYLESVISNIKTSKETSWDELNNIFLDIIRA